MPPLALTTMLLLAVVLSPPLSTTPPPLLPMLMPPAPALSAPSVRVPEPAASTMLFADRLELASDSVPPALTSTESRPPLLLPRLPRPTLPLPLTLMLLPAATVRLPARMLPPVSLRVMPALVLTLPSVRLPPWSVTLIPVPDPVTSISPVDRLPLLAPSDTVGAVMLPFTVKPPAATR